MHSKKINLGFVVVDTKSGEMLSDVFARREPAREAAKTLYHSGHPFVGVHTIQAHVPEDWKRGDSLEGYVDAHVLEKLHLNRVGSYTDGRAAELGERIAKCLDTSEAYEILGHEGTWQAGGCSLLAAALKRIFGPQAEALHVASDRSDAEHAVVRLGDLYFDADGAQARRKLFAKMKIERVPHPRLVPFNLDAAIAADHVYSERQLQVLIRFLEKSC